MSKNEEFDSQLKAFLIAESEAEELASEANDDADEDEDEDPLAAFGFGQNVRAELNHILPRMASLAKPLQALGHAALGLHTGGKSPKHSWNQSEETLKQIAAEERKCRKLQTEFDALAPDDRIAFFAALSPALAEALENTWQRLKAAPYKMGYQSEGFRAPNNPELTLPSRVQWLQRLAICLNRIRPDALTPVWLAEWAGHAFPHQSDVVVPLLASTMSASVSNAMSKSGEQVFAVLSQAVTREHAICRLGDHVIKALLQSDRPAGWQLMEKTLLAAERQEGLRQSILESANEAHPQAFARLLRLIVKENLLRFSAVARSVDGWLSVMWDSASDKALLNNVEGVLAVLESQFDPQTCKAAIAQFLAVDDPEVVYRALWVMALFDATEATVAAEKLLSHQRAEIRFVAVRILNQVALPAAHRAKLQVLDDVDLQVALSAAIGLQGVVGEAAEAAAEASDENFNQEPTEPGTTPSLDDTLFERIESLFNRLPEKPQTLKAIVWPWTERKIERSMLTRLLMNALGHRPPTRMLPYLKGLETWCQAQLVGLLAEQKKWDRLTRSTLFELCGHVSVDVRSAALAALAKEKMQANELEQLEAFLTRQATDLRNGVIRLIVKEADSVAVESAQRLLKKGDKKQRLAGLELLRQLATANRGRTQCQALAEEYQSKQKSLSTEEQTQLTAIGESASAGRSLENGFGFLNAAGRSPVELPKKQKTAPSTAAALACIQALDEVIDQHRTACVKIKNYSGWQDALLGEINSYSIPTLDLKKPLAAQRKAMPLIDTWEAWAENRPAELRDPDGFELLRAAVVIDLVNSYNFSWVRTMLKKPADKLIVLGVLGEIELPKLKYLGHIGRILEWLIVSELPKGTIDFFLDQIENSYAWVDNPRMQRLVEVPSEEKKPTQFSWLEVSDDWRDHLVFRKWQETFARFLKLSHIAPSEAQERRIWQLRRFFDEPCSGASRKRMSFLELLKAMKLGLANNDDLLDLLVGPRPASEPDFVAIRESTARTWDKDAQLLIDSVPNVLATVEQVRSFLLEQEVKRGEAATPCTQAVLAVQAFYGVEPLFRVMEALSSNKFKVDRSWRGNTGDSRSATLTQLLKAIYPKPEESSEAFEQAVRTATDAGYCTESRLLELAFLAPQWSKHIAESLAWEGFSEGLYWFLAHMNTWYSEAREAAAGAEGIEEDPALDSDAAALDGDDDGDDPNDSDGAATSQSIPKPKKLSAWERLILERTPLTLLEREEGAVDVRWFHQTWNALGETRWKMMADSAKLAANASQANKAQFLADTLLGNKSRAELIDGIKLRNLKENVRLLGLLPLALDAEHQPQVAHSAVGKHQSDLMERYQVLVGYKKYAMGLSTLTKPAAMRAAEIGISNLARLAGFPDPLRLEWSLEAESIADLAKGPVSVTRDNVTVTLSLDASAKPELKIEKAGKPLKTIPAALRKSHPALAELSERATELKKKSSRIRHSLESAMCRGDAIAASELVQLFAHAILAPELAKLILMGGGLAGYPERGGKVLRDHTGKLQPIPQNAALRIAHPSDLLMLGDWDQWQQECFRAERIQPFKQVFRELYPITQQEKQDQTRSNRFAGQQIGPKQAMALWNSRGWNTQDEVVKIFHPRSQAAAGGKPRAETIAEDRENRAIVAQVNFQFDYGTAAEIEGLTVESVEFRERDSYKPMPLAAVPTILFSEVMRDVDLVVSVAHRGEVDPEASASTVTMRASLMRETAALFGFVNVQVNASHALIEGYYGQYSLHLGSGTVHRLPGGAVAIVPVHAQHRGRIFLPFADNDPKTAEILSKMLLLAKDQEILDPSILDQLGAPVGSRPIKISSQASATANAANAIAKSKSVEAIAPTTQEAHGQASQTSGASSAPRRFECQEDGSSKFWEIAIDDLSVTTRWGRIGADGQSKTKAFADQTKAQAEYDKLIKEKTGKGYQAV